MIRRLLLKLTVKMEQSMWLLGPLEGAKKIRERAMFRFVWGVVGLGFVGGKFG
jgi:hypothetical protein